MIVLSRYLVFWGAVVGPGPRQQHSSRQRPPPVAAIRDSTSPAAPATGNSSTPAKKGLVMHVPRADSPQPTSSRPTQGDPSAVPAGLFTDTGAGSCVSRGAGSGVSGGGMR